MRPTPSILSFLDVKWMIHRNINHQFAVEDDLKVIDRKMVKKKNQGPLTYHHCIENKNYKFTMSIFFNFPSIALSIVFNNQLNRWNYHQSPIPSILVIPRCQMNASTSKSKPSIPCRRWSPSIWSQNDLRWRHRW